MAASLVDLSPALQLFRLESKRLKLPALFGRLIAEPLDADATGEATFYRCFDKIGGEKSERDGHIGLPNAAFLASTKLATVVTRPETTSSRPAFCLQQFREPTLIGTVNL
jgi:hypothetical protein